MNAAGSITMTMRALERLKVIEQVVGRNLSLDRLAANLRWVCAKPYDWYKAIKSKALLV